MTTSLLEPDAATVPSEPPPAPLLPPRPSLAQAATRLFTLLGYHLCGIPTDPSLGQLRDQARVVFTDMPWLFEPLMAIWGAPEAAADDDAPTDGGDGDEADPESAAAGARPATPRLLHRPDIVIGTSGTVAQCSLIARTRAPDGTFEGPQSEPVYFDTNGPECIVISGGNGSGKSSSAGVIIEAVSQHLPNLTHNQRLQCVVMFVVHNDNHELLAGRRENNDPRALRELMSVHKARPRGLRGLHRVVLPELVDEARILAPQIPITPLQLSPAHLGSRGWELLLGLEEHADTLYARTALAILTELRGAASLANFRAAVQKAKMPAHVRGLLEGRIGPAGRFLVDGAPDLDIIVPGAVNLVELYDPWMKHDQRVTMASVMLEVLLRKAQENNVNVLYVFDEAHHVLKHATLRGQIGLMLRERRHLRSSVLFSDQDMLALPQDLLALASLMIMHRNTGQENLRHHIRANPKWRHVDPRTLVDLAEGEAAILGAGGVLAPDLAHFLARPRFVRMRQRASMPGGHTLTVV